MQAQSTPADVPNAREVLSDGKSFWHPRLPRLRLPQVAEGKIPFGFEFANNLLSLLKDRRLLIPDASVVALEVLADFARSRNSEFARWNSTSANLLNGVSGTAPEYIIMVGPPIEVEPDFHLLRLIYFSLLQFPEGNWPRGTKQAIGKLRDKAIALSSRVGVTGALSLLDHLWTDSSFEPEQIKKLLAQQLELKRSSLDAVMTLIWSGHIRCLCRHGDPPGGLREWAIPLSGVKNGVPIEEVVYKRSKVLPAIHSGDDAESILVTRERHFLSNQKAYSAQASRLHLEGALLPGTDRVLCLPEAKAVASYLLREAASQHSLARRANAVSLLISLLTSASRRIVLASLLAIDADPDARRGFWITESDWTHGERFNDIYGSLPDGAQHAFAPTSSALKLPLPSVVSSCYREIKRSCEGSFELLTRLEADINHLRTELKRICSRATEGRIRNVVPVYLYGITGDIRLSQIFAGSDLGHTTAALHYFAVDSRQILSPYCQLLSELGLTKITSPELGYLIGAPRAGLKPIAVKAAVAALKTRVQTDINSSDPQRRLLGLTMWTAVMFSAAVLHRWTHHIDLMTRRRIREFSDSPNVYSGRFGVASVLDKHCIGEIDFRTTAVGPTLLAQLDAMLDVQHFSSQSTRYLHREFREPVAESVAGSGSLFVIPHRKSGGRVATRALTATDIASYWPEWPGPIALWRHYVASHAVAHGARPSDVAQQLGHSIDGAPFSEIDPDSPIRFASRVAAWQELLLNDVGFAVIRSKVSNRISAPPLKALSLAELPMFRKVSSTPERSKDTENQIPVASISEQQKNALHEALSAKVIAVLDSAAYGSPPEMSPGQIEALQHSLIDAHHDSPPEIVSELFAKVLVQYVERHDEARIAMPTVFIEAPNWRSPIHPFHLECYGWTLELIRRCVDAVGTRDGELRKTAHALLLAAYAGITNVERLSAIIRQRASAAKHPSRNGTWIVSVPRQGNQRYREAFLIDGAGGYLFEAFALDPDRNEFCASGTFNPLCDEAINKLLGGLSGISQDVKHERFSLAPRVLEAVAAGRSLLQPGLRSAWERGELSSVTLDVDRFDRILRNECKLIESRHNVPSYAPEKWTLIGDGMSRFLTEYSSLRAKLPKKATQKTRSELVSDLRDDEVSGNPSTFFDVMRLWVAQVLSGRLRISSLETYLSALKRWGIAVYRISDDGVLRDDLMATALDEVLTETVEGSAQSATLASALKSFIPILSQYCELDETLEYCQEASHGVVAADGYGASVSERKFILESARFYSNHSKQHIGDIHPQTSTAFAAAAFLGVRGGLRIGEVSGLQLNAAKLYGDLLIVDVRPRRGYRLKTLASLRPLVIKLDSGEQEWWRSTLNLLEQQPEQREGLLCLHTPTRSGTRSHLSALYSELAGHVLPKGAARFHHSRHDRARAAVAECLGIQESVGGVEAPPAPEISLRSIPLRSQLLYQARQLGHGSSHSILVSYCNLIGLLPETDLGMIPLLQSHRAQLYGIKEATYRMQLSRAGKRGQINRIPISSAETSLPQPPQLTRWRRQGFSLSDSYIVLQGYRAGLMHQVTGKKTGYAPEQIKVLGETLRVLERERGVSLKGYRGMRDRGKDMLRILGPLGTTLKSWGDLELRRVIVELLDKRYSTEDVLQRIGYALKGQERIDLAFCILLWREVTTARKSGDSDRPISSEIQLPLVVS